MSRDRALSLEHVEHDPRGVDQDSSGPPLSSSRRSRRGAAPRSSRWRSPSARHVGWKAYTCGCIIHGRDIVPLPAAW